MHFTWVEVNSNQYRFVNVSLLFLKWYHLLFPWHFAISQREFCINIWARFSHITAFWSYTILCAVLNFWYSLTETSQNKIKVANDSPCSSCTIPNAMTFKNKINLEIEPFENLGGCRTSYENAHNYTFKHEDFSAILMTSYHVSLQTFPPSAYLRPTRRAYRRGSKTWRGGTPS